MNRPVPLVLAGLVLLPSCSASLDRNSIRTQIEASIQASVVATRDKDIDTYMALLPRGAEMLDESGGILSREQQRANTLRDWSIIHRTLSVGVVIDSLSATADSAIVFTSQRWAQLMFRRDGVTLDTVLTTQKHRELWRPTSDGWRSYRVEELGGSVWINGALYTPDAGA